MLIAEYDGFMNPRSVVLDKIVVWARILKFPNNFLFPKAIQGMCRKMGKVLEVQTTLPAGFVGEFVRVRVELQATKRLIRFVGIIKNEAIEYYQVQYEKLPDFCGNCDMLGHWYEECGTGEHDVSKLECEDFLLADGGRGRGQGRAAGRNSGRGRGGIGRGDQPFGPGRGRGAAPSGFAGQGTVQSWRHNALFNSGGTEEMETDDGEQNGIGSQDVRNMNVLGKRAAHDTQPAGSGMATELALIPAEANSTPGNSAKFARVATDDPQV